MTGRVTDSKRVLISNVNSESVSDFSRFVGETYLFDSYHLYSLMVVMSVGNGFIL